MSRGRQLTNGMSGRRGRSQFDVEPLTGMTMSGHKRGQVLMKKKPGMFMLNSHNLFVSEVPRRCSKG